MNEKILRLLFDKENSVLHKTPNQKNVLIIVSFFLLLIAWINKPTIDSEKIKYIDRVVLGKKPEYGRDYGKKHGPWIKLKLKDDNSIYKIDGYVYETLNHDKFKADIEQFDTLRIGILGSDIYSLVKNDFDYCDIKKINKKKSSFIYFIRIITIISITVLFILKGLEKERINVKWDIIYIVSMILTTIILLLK